MFCDYIKALSGGAVRGNGFSGDVASGLGLSRWVSAEQRCLCFPSHKPGTETGHMKSHVAPLGIAALATLSSGAPKLTTAESGQVRKIKGRKRTLAA